jgi:hypothetical protein
VEVDLEGSSNSGRRSCFYLFSFFFSSFDSSSSLSRRSCVQGDAAPTDEKRPEKGLFVIVV